MWFQCFGRLFVLIFILLFSIAVVSPVHSGSRIMPSGAVKVFDGNKIVQILEQESPLPDGALLTSEGKCGVRMENVYFVAEDKAMFGLVDALNGIDLRVDIGVIHFAITRDTGRLSFHTPAGVIFTQQVRFDAAADGGILNGYVDVSAQQVKIGVVNGGTILVSTEQGVKKIFSGKQVAISTVEPIKDKGAYQTVENRDPFYGEAENVDVIPADYFAGEGVGLLGSPVDLNPIER